MLQVPSTNLPPPMFPPDCLVSSPPLVMSSPLDPLALLVLSSSSALPQLPASCVFSALPQTSPPPMWREAESPTSPQLSRPMSPPRPDSSGLPHTFGSASVSHRSASTTDFRVSGCTLTLHPFGFTGFSFPPASPSSPKSAESPSMPQSCESATPPWAFGLWMSPWSVGLSVTLDTPRT
ncbi:unnamed protein product [Leuciscus chuanchicus]